MLAAVERLPDIDLVDGEIRNETSLSTCLFQPLTNSSSPNLLADDRARLRMATSSSLLSESALEKALAYSDTVLA